MSKKLPEKSQKAVVDFAEAKATAKSATERWRELQPALVAAMKKLGQKSTTVTTDEVSIKVTLVEPEPGIAIDPEKLRKKLGAKTWAKVTTRQLDTAKLNDAISRGLVSASDVALCSEEKPPASPHIKETVTLLSKEE